jgi:uncharacterized membrane protein YhfC
MLGVMHGLAPLLMVSIPLLLAAVLVRRWRLDWAVFGLGALTFITSQVLHIPFNQFVLNPQLQEMGGQGWAWVAVALLLGLSAGIFEELARYFMLGRLASRVRDWHQGVLYGVGHGGIEAILLGALGFYSLFQALTLRGVALEGIVPPERLEITRLQLEAYWGLAWYEPLWGVLERISALAYHVLAALMVLKAVVHKRRIWLFGAVLAHTLFNAVALIAVKNIGVAGTELLLAGIGGLSVWATFRLRPSLTSGDGEDDAPRAAGPGQRPRGLPAVVETERIDESKFV